MPKDYASRSSRRRGGRKRGSTYGRNGGWNSRRRSTSARRRAQSRSRRISALILLIFVVFLGFGILQDARYGTGWLRRSMSVQTAATDGQTKVLGGVSWFRRHSEHVTQSLRPVENNKPLTQEGGVLGWLHRHRSIPAVAPSQMAADDQPAEAAVPTVHAPAPAPVQPQKPHFEFYHMLSQPKSEDMSPSVHGGTGYELRVGSFRSKVEAEKMQDKLALSGYPVDITTVHGLSGTWYRVTTGPYRNLINAHQAQNELRGLNIQSTLHRRGGR